MTQRWYPEWADYSATHDEPGYYIGDEVVEPGYYLGFSLEDVGRIISEMRAAKARKDCE